MSFHFAHWFVFIVHILDTASLATLVGAALVCSSAPTSCAGNLIMLCNNDIAAATLIALVLMEWTIDPFLQLIKLVLLALGNSALCRVNLSKRVLKLVRCCGCRGGCCPPVRPLSCFVVLGEWLWLIWLAVEAT